MEANTKEKGDASALFIPACLFVGLAMGFVIHQVVIGTVGGLALGFLIFAVIKNLKGDNAWKENFSPFFNLPYP